MLARKWIEQWWVWIAVDVISSGLYTFKGIYLYAALYMLYAIIAIYGYYKWKELMKADDVATKL
jgi:nicotinamide mononucleotide transporter